MPSYRHAVISVCRYIVMVTYENQILSVSEKLKISNGGHKYPAMAAMERFFQWTGMECCAIVKSGGFRLSVFFGEPDAYSFHKGIDS